MKEILTSVFTLAPRRRMRTALLFAVALCAALQCSSAAAHAFGIDSFGGSYSDPSGAALRQAGAHPDVTTAIEFPFGHNADGSAVPDGNVKDIVVQLPPGVVGNPNAAPTCTIAQLRDSACPVNSQVGILELRLAMYAPDPFPTPAPIYNIEPPPGIPARFGFNAFKALTFIDAGVRSGADYGISADIHDISSSLAITGNTLTLWGVPADPSHDAERVDPVTSMMGVPSTAPRRPFMTNPTRCATTPLETQMRTRSWQDQGVFHSASFDHDLSREPIRVDGCEDLPFAPQIAVAPASRQAGSPTGLQVDLTVPQSDNPDGLATAHLRRAVVTLPEGMSLSPSSADGLGACSPADVALSSAGAARCPDASKLGTVQIDTPLLSDPMQGSIYLARQGENPFGSLLALYLVAEGHGVTIKLAGKIATDDPAPGRVTATFDDAPQLPFSKLSLRFDGGPRAALSNPTTCGVKTTTAELTAWSGKVVSTSSSFTIDQGVGGGTCGPQGFAPGFSAGTTSNAAGRYAPFTLRFSRSDADQALGSIAVNLPAGLLGRIASVPLCGDAQATAGTCGEASRVGAATTQAGPGALPFALPGRVYMTGPYKGAPFGLSIVVPARAGPLDLGLVVVRAAVFVDKRTTALRIVSDPLPTILQGIPLQIRSVQIAIDRDGFMFNPTSCSAKRIGARIRSRNGVAPVVRARFQAASCGALPYQPRLSLKVGAKGRTGPRSTTPLEARLTMSGGQANNRAVRVTLPKTLTSRLEVVRQACSMEEFEAGRCSERARIGSGVAITPVLRDPLRGPAYFVRNPARRLPDIVVALRGQVAVDLVGKVTIPRDLSLRTDFDTIPDVPISAFTLRLRAGSNGVLGNVADLCSASTRRASVARLAFRAHNGKLVTRKQTMTVAGCAKPASASARGTRPR